MAITYVDLEPKKVVKKPRLKKFLLIFLAVFLIFIFCIGAATIYYYPKISTLAVDTKEISKQAGVIEKNIKDQDVLKAKENTIKLRLTLEKTERDLKKLGILGRLPIVKGYYADADHGLRAAVLGTTAGEIVADSLIPFGDILGLKGVESNLTAEKKAEVLVTQAFPELSKKSSDLEKILKDIKTQVDYIDPNRYPTFLSFGGFKPREKLISAKGGLEDLEAFFPSIKDFLEAVPTVLGYQQEKIYLLWFQNDKELRPTGGFITAYGILKVKNGKLISVDSDDIYQLDLKFTPYEPPPAYLKKYLLLHIFPIRDANIYPDFKDSAEKFESFYARIKGMPKIDGIVSIDTEMVRKLLEYTGPIKIKKFNETFSAQDHPKYKIPDVVYKLELYAEKVLAGQRDRKGLVGDLMDEILNKVLSAPPEKFPELLKILQASTDEKHFQFYFHDPKAQKLAEQLNYAGRIKNFEGDYLHINNSNFAGLKGNLYIKAQVEQDITISSDGTVTKKVTTTLRNIEKADGWLNAVYQNLMRVYVPRDSKLIDKKVFADFAERGEYAKTVWESFSRTHPLNKSVTSFTYELPFKIKKGDTYRLLMQKQGGTTDPFMIIRLNGKVIREFDLKKDTEIGFKI